MVSLLATPTPSSSSSTTNPHAPSVDVSRLRLFPSEPYYWHSKAVTSLSARVVSITDSNSGVGGGDEQLLQQQDIYSLPTSGRRKLLSKICSIGKDSQLKVVKIEQDLNMSEYYDKANLGRSPMADTSIARTTCQISRSFSASGSTLSSCATTSDGSRAIFSSWDNHIYGYSIVHACAIGKRFAHYDSVTSISMDKK